MKYATHQGDTGRWLQRYDINQRFDGSNRKLANASIASATDSAVDKLAATVLCAVSGTIPKVPL